MKKKMTFEEAISRLSEVVETLESGETPLEGALKLFEEGASLTSYCMDQLNNAEQRIQQISEFEQKGEAAK